MSKTKRLASLTSGIGLVVAFIAWLGLRDGLISTVSNGIVVPLLLHGIAWMVLIGGVSLLAAASAAMSHSNDREFSSAT
jgi:asparagine N-glycosylation enzyme membrane subunit Stt3